MFIKILFLHAFGRCFSSDLLSAWETKSIARQNPKRFLMYWFLAKDKQEPGNVWGFFCLIVK